MIKFNPDYLPSFCNAAWGYILVIADIAGIVVPQSEIFEIKNMLDRAVSMQSIFSDSEDFYEAYEKFKNEPIIISTS